MAKTTQKINCKSCEYCNASVCVVSGYICVLTRLEIFPCNIRNGKHCKFHPLNILLEE